MKNEASAPLKQDRVEIEGKFFRLRGKRFWVKGVTYGPFAPDARGETFGDPKQLERDLDLLQELGGNVLRTYYPPPGWFLDQVESRGLRVFADIPWSKHLCVCDSPARLRQVRDEVRRAVASSAGRSAIMALSVANEIPSEIVRYSGPSRVQGLIEELIELGRRLDPTRLFTYANYPSTEFLSPVNTDFVTFNLYLHTPADYRAYLNRLQMLADRKPLVFGEVGMDSLRGGEDKVGDFLAWQLDEGFRKGVAGVCVFSFTDDWHRGGYQVEDWAFGLTTRQRERKEAFDVVQDRFSRGPVSWREDWPKVSVVVASYNGASTLRACLDSLEALDYPAYEVILVDDGSTDETPKICGDYAWVRTIRQENFGLSAARNTGIAAAQGQIVAFTDSDCRADRTWLRYLVNDLMESGAVGVGGHNLLPPDDSVVAAAVMVAPGGPTHVMLSDVEAEHIPGCNMAFYRSALMEVGGFDSVFRKAGDDVDVCWRLQQHGYSLAFSPAGFVWHYRRSTVGAYLRQQMGYGEAEALLARKHPEFFNRVGSGIWRGRIYGAEGRGLTLRAPVIYHGLFGSGLFQRLYSAPPSGVFLLASSPEYVVLVILPTLLLAMALPAVWLIAGPALLLPILAASAAAYRAHLPREQRRWWSRLLVGALVMLQPLARGLSRYRRRLALVPTGRPPAVRTADLPLVAPGESDEALAFWAATDVDRLELVRRIAAEAEGHGFHVRQDTGWHGFDLELVGDRWARFQLMTTTEELERGERAFRCRITTQWSVMANAVFWGAGLGVLFSIWVLAPYEPWIWMLPLALPLLLWLIEIRQLITASIIAALVRVVTEREGMQTVESS